MAHLIDWENLDRDTIFVPVNGLPPHYSDTFHRRFDSWDPKREYVYGRGIGFCPYPEWLKRCRHNQDLRKSVECAVQFEADGVYKVHGTDMVIGFWGKRNVMAVFNLPYGHAELCDAFGGGVKLRVTDDGVQYVTKNGFTIYANEKVELTKYEQDVVFHGKEYADSMARMEQEKAEKKARVMNEIAEREAAIANLDPKERESAELALLMDKCLKYKVISHDECSAQLEAICEKYKTTK